MTVGQQNEMFQRKSIGNISWEICGDNVFFGEMPLSRLRIDLGLLYKLPSLAYASYACMNLYGIMLNIDGYVTHFLGMQFYVMMITICRLPI